MIKKAFVEKLKQDHVKQSGERRQIISRSNIVLHDSKRVIFSLHRGDVDKAEKSLKEIERSLQKMEKEFGYRRINEEGAYRACAEEYAEAKLFYLVTVDGTIDKFRGVRLSYDSYLGGLCDLTGELVRRAVNEAAEGNIAQVRKMKKIIDEIMAELIEFDMTGYLRTKYDQARSSLRKIEQINYETSTKR